MKTLSQIIKSQISNSKSQMVRQAHHPEPGRRANSNDQNSKFQTCTGEMKMTKDLMFWSLNIGICDLFVIWCLLFGI
jgi:hypothetical protein